MSRCSHGARLHTRPQGGRTGRPRRPQDAHTAALAWGRRASVRTVPPTQMPRPSLLLLEHHLCTRPSHPTPKTPLTITGATESTLQAAAAPILAPPGTPATVGAPQAQGALGCLGTAQGAALGPSEQPPAASGHTSQGQVGGAQTLSRGSET